jgi:hypothetical protein
MSAILTKTLQTLGFLFILSASGAATAQTQQAAGTLVIAGQQDQAPLVRIRGRSYIDVESLARIMHGSVSFQGTQTILTLPGTQQPGSAQSVPARTLPQLSANYLSAQVQALTQIREWRAALVNAVQTNLAVTDAWVSPLKRSADAKLQLAIAATSTDPDQQAATLLRNEFSAMQQLSDQFVAVHAQATYTSPDSFENNTQDQKIVSCEQALGAMASSKQFQDVPACH